MSPIVYGIINAIFPGLAYLMLRKREKFGLLLVISGVAGLMYGFVEPAVWNMPTLGSTPLSVTLGLIALVTAPFAFAFDAYDLAKNRR
jgi:uncharacterized membrane protein HdeD (DUF308 family)